MGLCVFIKYLLACQKVSEVSEVNEADWAVRNTMATCAPLLVCSPAGNACQSPILHSARRPDRSSGGSSFASVLYRPSDDQPTAVWPKARARGTGSVAKNRHGALSLSPLFSPISSRPAGKRQANAGQAKMQTNTLRPTHARTHARANAQTANNRLSPEERFTLSLIGPQPRNVRSSNSKSQLTAPFFLPSPHLPVALPS